MLIFKSFSLSYQQVCQAFACKWLKLRRSQDFFSPLLSSLGKRFVCKKVLKSDFDDYTMYI